MFSRIEELVEKKIVGKRLKMTTAENRTAELWKSFMPRRREISNIRSSDLFSIQVFDKDFDFRKFDLNRIFEKWAGAEVIDFVSIPDGMEPLILKSGTYAVFIHKGGASRGEETFRYIFNSWIPLSGYIVDDRPHFEILGEKYKNEDPDSEEEIWIPVRPVE